MPDSAQDYLKEIRSGQLGLINVPRKSKSHSICLAAVTVNGLDIYHVPKHFRSDTVCFAAVYQNPEAVKFIEPDYLVANAAIIEMAVSRQGQIFLWVKNNLPSAVITENLCLKAVRACGAMLAHIPEEFVTRDLVLQAVLRDATALNSLFLSSSNIVKDSINTVVDEIPLKHLPDHFKTYAVCIRQVARQGRLLRYVPFSLIDKAMVDAALTSNPWAIEFVPMTFKDLASVRSVIENGSIPSDIYRHIEGDPEFIYDSMCG